MATILQQRIGAPVNARWAANHKSVRRSLLCRVREALMTSAAGVHAINAYPSLPQAETGAAGTAASAMSKAAEAAQPATPAAAAPMSIPEWCVDCVVIGLSVRAEQLPPR